MAARMTHERLPSMPLMEDTPTALLMSKRAMEIKAEEGIPHPYIPPRPPSAQLLRYPECTGIGRPIKRSTTPDSTSTVIVSRPPGLMGGVRRGRAGSMPSSFNSEQTTVTCGINSTGKDSSRTSGTILHPRAAHVRGMSLALPVSTLSAAFGHNIFAHDISTVSPPGNPGSTARDDPMSDVNDEHAMSIVRSLDYLDIGDNIGSTTSSAPPNHSGTKHRRADSSTVSEDKPTRSLWVGNLGEDVTSADLMNVFASYGNIESLRMIKDKECAFINFMHLDEATKAKNGMQGRRIKDSVIRVGFGKLDFSASPSISTSTSITNSSRTVWIGNLSVNTTPAQLHALFSPYGCVESARVLTHRSCGFVNFDSVENAIRARNAMHGKEINGTPIRVGFAKVPNRAPSISDLHSHPHTHHHSSSSVGHSRSGSGIVPLAAQAAALQHTLSLSKSSITTGEPLVNGSGGGDGGAFSRYDLQHGGLAASMQLDKKLLQLPYALVVPPVPEPNPNRRVEQVRLRELRRLLDALAVADNAGETEQGKQREVDAIFEEIHTDCIDLCTDYVGNTVIQKISEHGNDGHKLMLVEKTAPYLAAMGVHKNGTWAVQKMIALANSDAQMAIISRALRPYTPPLLLDQFGNYVVQCCLRFGETHNQFVFDAIHARCWEIAQGRFGARAIRSVLESEYITRRQKMLVAIALVNHAVLLATHTNGNILLTWLLDSSALPGRYRSVAPQFVPNIEQLCCHKLASVAVLKIINQKYEVGARDELINAIFFAEDWILRTVIQDAAYGLPLVHKALVSESVDDSVKCRIAERVGAVCSGADLVVKD